LRRTQLRGEKNEKLPGQAGIGANASVLRGVPEDGPVLSPYHVRAAVEIGGEYDFFADDVGAIRVVVDLTVALVANPFASPIRGSPGDASPLPT
jgi:hypothetical protein